MTKLTAKQIDAVYASTLRCIKNHDVSVEELQKLWDILVADSEEKVKIK